MDHLLYIPHLSFLSIRYHNPYILYSHHHKSGSDRHHKQLILYIRTYIYTYIYTHTLHTHTHTHTITHVRIYTYVHTHRHTHIHTYIYTQAHALHTCTFIPHCLLCIPKPSLHSVQFTPVHVSGQLHSYDPGLPEHVPPF